ncbi:MAG: nitrous oxide reductase family maturation protein NosD, partial [Pseudomonadota bacterium]
PPPPPPRPRRRIPARIREHAAAGRGREVRIKQGGTELHLQPTVQPAVQLVRWSQKSFPATLPGGVLDSFPLMSPVDKTVPPDIAAMEAEVAGRWATGNYDDIDPDDLESH